MFVAHPPTVKLIPKGTKRSKERIKQHGELFQVISKQPHKTLVATPDGKWATWVEKNDDDFEIAEMFHPN